MKLQPILVVTPEHCFQHLKQLFLEMIESNAGLRTKAASPAAVMYARIAAVGCGGPRIDSSYVVR